MIVDVNVNLSRWPFRRLTYDEPVRFVSKLRSVNVTQAWAGSFDALLHRDLASVNSRLVADCARYGNGLLLPVGTINPTLPDWREDLRRCDEQHRMHAIRLYPNYHGYDLSAQVCDELFGMATERRLIIQLVLKMEDVRTHHPLMRVPTVDPKPITELVRKHSEVRLIVMNNYGSLSGPEARDLALLGHVYFEISHAERVGALDKLLENVPVENLLFGSHFPFFTLESALLKFRESQIGGLATQMIQHDNCRRLTQELLRE